MESSMESIASDGEDDSFASLLARPRALAHVAPLVEDALWRHPHDPPSPPPPLHPDQRDAFPLLPGPCFNEFVERARARPQLSPMGDLMRRELTGPLPARAFGGVQRLRTPLMLSECYMEQARGFNKLFAHAWLDEDHVVTGSKCNQLALWDVSDPRAPVVSLCRLPPPFARLEEVPSGIHSVAVNRARTLVASGSGNPNETVVLDTATWRTRALCVGHTDWMFGCRFVTDDVLWTCSRDSTLCVWRVPEPPCSTGLQGSVVVKPISKMREHSRKVRALTFNVSLNVVCSLGADSSAVFWDAQRASVVSTHRIRDVEEIMCVETDPTLNVFACGGRDFVELMDPRMQRSILCLHSPDESFGVRSVNFHRGLLSTGGGLGRLSFFDLAAARWVPCRDQPKPDFPRSTHYHELGPGFVVPPDVALIDLDHEPDDLRMTVYTHGWSPSGARLFAGGGPLMLNLSGSYAAVW